MGANYRQIFEKKKGVWKQENTPHLNATFRYKYENIDFSTRSRFEYRDREDADNYWRYRNKSSVKFPLKLTKFEIQPYLADEIFVDFDAEELNTNRFYTGIIFKIFKQLKGDLYYLWQSKKEAGDWIDYNITGTKLSIGF